MNNRDRAMLIAPLVHAAQAAGERIMVHYAGARQARAKADNSPLTEADMEAHAVIGAALAVAFPDVRVVSEEDASFAAADAAGAFFVVDPLDGTRAFVRGDGEFTVNIALVERTRPVFGVIYAPVQRILYYGGEGMGAFRVREDSAPEAIRARPAPPEGMVVARSRSIPSLRAREFLKTIPVQEIRPCSSAIKFCWLAEGAADIYPRFGRTMEWDTAAGQAILEGAGGSVHTLDGTPLSYAKLEFENPPFVARGI